MLGCGSVDGIVYNVDRAFAAAEEVGGSVARTVGSQGKSSLFDPFLLRGRCRLV